MSPLDRPRSGSVEPEPPSPKVLRTVRKQVSLLTGAHFFWVRGDHLTPSRDPAERWPGRAGPPQTADTSADMSSDDGEETKDDRTRDDGTRFDVERLERRKGKQPATPSALLERREAARRAWPGGAAKSSAVRIVGYRHKSFFREVVLIS